MPWALAAARISSSWGMFPSLSMSLTSTCSMAAGMLEALAKRTGRTRASARAVPAAAPSLAVSDLRSFQAKPPQA